MNDQSDIADLLKLQIARKQSVTDDLCLFDLVSPDGVDLPPFTAGAHLAIRTPAGGMRHFSLSNDPIKRDAYQLGIKAERTGRGGSASMVDQTSEGDFLEVSAPKNDFPLVPGPEYLFVAGGIGITPIISMVRQVIRENTTPFRLFYCTRSAETTPFLSELSAPELEDRVVIHHDDGDSDKAFDFWDVFETPSQAQVYCCGPAALMEEIRGVSGHWPQSAIHFEEFHSGIEAVKEDDRAFRVRNASTGETIEVPANRTILEALRDAGVQLRSSCESGTCGTCKTRLVAGDPDHRDLVLMAEEKSDHIMLCVSRAKSEELVLDW